VPHTFARTVGWAIVTGLAAWAPAAAQDDADERPFPTTEFVAGETSASVSADGVTATVTLVTPDDPSFGYVPTLAVSVDGIKVAEASGAESDFEVPAAEASIARIDPDNAYPEVYFASYSGGAHCCTTVIVVTEMDGDWAVVPVGDFDGDGDYLTDIDGDGIAEIVTVDNRFLYRFDSYAASAAPLVVYTVRDGEVVDVTTETRYLPAQRDWLSQLEAALEPDDRWSSRGFLAGWLAQRIRLGEGAAAWEEINTHWDFAADEGEPVCMDGGEPEDCATDQLATVKFPERLRLFLAQNGYGF
jgi:hypothetical protein